MRKFKKIAIFPLFLAGIAAFAAVAMLLWNWLMPTIFGLSVISFWQAAGLLILARLFFGGHFIKTPHGHKGPRGMRGKRGCGGYFKREFEKEFDKELRKEFFKHWNNKTAEERRKIFEERIKNGDFPFDRSFFEDEATASDDKRND